MSRITKTASIGLIAGVWLSAQVPNPTQQVTPATESGATPVFRIEVVARSTQAVNYLHRGGSTKVDFQGTALMPMGHGSAKVESERGVIHVQAELKDFAPPSSFGPEYLTYVLWAISPDGRPVNLGELTLDHYGTGSNSKIDTTSDIQTFGMIITAEPYYAVTQPSDVVVMENVIRPDTQGVKEMVNARYELLPRGTYTLEGRAGTFAAIQVGKKDPFELYEAENAVQIARLAGADKYASESYMKATDALQRAERYQAQKPGQKPVITMAREAVVRAEDARTVAMRRQIQEQRENERQAAIAREDAAKQRAEAAKAQAAQAEEDRRAAELSKARAQASAEQTKAEAVAAIEQARIQKEEAEAARQAAEREKNEANAARQAAIEQQQQLAADAEKARAAAANADRLREKAEQDQAQLRRQLLQQFNVILQTRDTARGLIVNMSDVLFDSGKYTLRSGAREKLAKVAGIILGHPGLKIEVEGYTDSVGGADYNQRLSENRANAVRDYLVAQGLNRDNVSGKGFGEASPVADNSTAHGRQMNRRVEMVVSGEIIGNDVTTATSSAPQ